MITRIQEIAAVEPFDIRTPGLVVDRIKHALGEQRPVAIGWFDMSYLGKRKDGLTLMYFLIYPDCVGPHREEALRKCEGYDMIRWQRVIDIGRSSEISEKLVSAIASGGSVVLVPERLDDVAYPDSVPVLGWFAAYVLSKTI